MQRGGRRNESAAESLQQGIVFEESFMKRTALAAMLLTLAGCSCADRLFSNSSYIVEPIVMLPNGEEIGAGIGVREQWGKTTVERHFATWKRNDRFQELALQTEPDWQNKKPVGSLHLTEDGNRAWLTDNGKTVASYDYVAAVAIHGTQNQPAWAKPGE
jgi:hypothetical protein